MLLSYVLRLAARRVCSNPTDFQCDTITPVDRLNCQSQYYVCDGDFDCVFDRSDENHTFCDARVCQVRATFVSRSVTSIGLTSTIGLSAFRT